MLLILYINEQIKLINAKKYFEKIIQYIIFVKVLYHISNLISNNIISGVSIINIIIINNSIIFYINI